VDGFKEIKGGISIKNAFSQKGLSPIEKHFLPNAKLSQLGCKTDFFTFTTMKGSHHPGFPAGMLLQLFVDMSVDSIRKFVIMPPYYEYAGVAASVALPSYISSHSINRSFVNFFYPGRVG
jgi:hypothetical protein